MSAEMKSGSFTISRRGVVWLTVIHAVALMILMTLSLALMPFQRVDRPKVVVEDPSAPLVVGAETRMKTNERDNEFFKQVDSDFALKMSNSSIHELKAKRAEIEGIMRKLPADDLDQMEYEFQIGFIAIELKKRYGAVLAQVE